MSLQVEILKPWNRENLAAFDLYDPLLKLESGRRLAIWDYSQMHVVLVVLFDAVSLTCNATDVNSVVPRVLVKSDFRFVG